MSDAAVSISGLHKSFGKLEVLRGIDLELAQHEVVCLIGASGSGKSTLLRCVNLLEPIDTGRIEVQGEEITARGVDVNRDGWTDLQVRTDDGSAGEIFDFFTFDPRTRRFMASREMKAIPNPEPVAGRMGVELAAGDQLPERHGRAEQQIVSLAYRRSPDLGCFTGESCGDEPGQRPGGNHPLIGHQGAADSGGGPAGAWCQQSGQPGGQRGGSAVVDDPVGAADDSGAGDDVAEIGIAEFFAGLRFELEFAGFLHSFQTRITRGAKNPLAPR